MIYPPQLQVEKVEQDSAYGDDEDAATERIYALSQALEKLADATPIDDFVVDEFPEGNLDDDLLAKKRKEQEQLKRLRTLFDGLKIFLSREVPRQSLGIRNQMLWWSSFLGRDGRIWIDVSRKR